MFTCPYQVTVRGLTTAKPAILTSQGVTFP